MVVVYAFLGALVETPPPGFVEGLRNQVLPRGFPWEQGISGVFLVFLVSLVIMWLLQGIMSECGCFMQGIMSGCGCFMQGTMSEFGGFMQGFMSECGWFRE